MTIIKTNKKLAKRRPGDFYETPLELCSRAIEYLILPKLPNPTCIVDPGAGKGQWGYAARQYFSKAQLIGIEINEKFTNPGWYDIWHPADYMNWHMAQTPDLIVGNPPFREAEGFIRTGWDSLVPGGYMLLVLRLSFLESRYRHDHLWLTHRPESVTVLAERVSWYGNKRSDDTAYALYLWQKRTRFPGTRLHWLAWRH